MVALLNMPRAAWKRQPSNSERVGVNWGNPLASWLAFLTDLSSAKDVVKNAPGVITGTKKVINRYGISRGFYSTYGAATTDKALFNVNLSSLQRTIFFRFLRNGDGGNSLGRIFDGANQYILNASGEYHYYSARSTTGGVWYISQEFNQTVVDLVITYDASSTSNSPYFYLNGLLKSKSTLQLPSGTAADTISALAIGNSNSVARGFDGFIQLGAFWSRVLSPYEIAELSRNPWQLFAPAPSRFYLIPSSGGVITLIVQKATHGHTVESPSLTQAHVLALAESLHGHTVESPLLSQAYALTLAAAAHAHTVEALDLTQAHSLSVAETSHSHSTDNVSLFQAHVLNLSDALHGHSVEAPTLTMAGSLLVVDANHSHSADAPALTQAHTITAQDASHGHSTDAVTLTQAYVLAPVDTAHGHSSEVPTLSTELNLLVADSLHSHTVEAPGLTQAHVLSLADSLHGHSAEAVSMGQGYSLIVADANHNHSVESPTVSVAFVLAIQDALHNQAADSLALATHVTLIVSDTLHAHLAGTASEITLPTGDRIFLVAREDRLFLVATEDRLFGV